MLRDLLARLRQSFTAAPDALAIIDDVTRAPHVSGLDRRTFLRRALLGAAVVATVDVEQLLWLPGEKTIVIPSPVDLEGLLTGNCFVTDKWIAREALRLLKRNLSFASSINREYDAAYDEAVIVRARGARRVA